MVCKDSVRVWLLVLFGKGLVRFVVFGNVLVRIGRISFLLVAWPFSHCIFVQRSLRHGLPQD